MEIEELEVMIEELMEVVEQYDDDMEVTGQDEFKADMSVGWDRVLEQGVSTNNTNNNLLEENTTGVQKEIVFNFQNISVQESNLGSKNSMINQEFEKYNGKRKGCYVESSRGVKRMKMD